MKKGKRMASVVLVLSMLLSMFTVVNAAETTLEPVTYRQFLNKNGSINDGADGAWGYGIGNEAYNLGKLMTAGGFN